ncbi:mandelate racemase/muconate lactonizing enzyme [Cystobasidium minutum MCA 4210]|uniref:mandelate racemase/muconate lactonizing enzyme n=1 Tax=Cystobasidium minutum MCA 4210 TaxID=1397322 RepID=UPI0034CE4D7A|eukprot:jgi/Rhomi1/35052/CE35051_2075
MVLITGFDIHDLRFPTSLSGDGTDAMNTECDYSAAYIILKTSSDLKGYGMTFTIGRGNDIVCDAMTQVAKKLVGKDTEALFSNMGQTWAWLTADPQLRWIGPEKGVIALATGSVSNALWDMFARARGKPLWKLICDFTPEEFVQSTAFRYISDAITKEEALELLKSREATKQERTEKVLQQGYPAYTTSVGWAGYDDDKVVRLTKEAIDQGFNHFKVKVGISPEDDARRLALVRSVIDDPANFKDRKVTPSPESLQGKNAGPTGCVLMMDANQVWDVDQAIEWCKKLSKFNLWFIEEPTAPDDVLGHAKIRAGLKGIMGVATGEHAHNRMTFKQLLQANAIDVCQIDSCRMSGISEILAVLLMAAKFNVPVCPHAGGVGLCELVIHLSLIDYIAVSGTMERNVLEYVDHLHEQFVYPVSINSQGRYNVPQNAEEGYSIRMHEEAIKVYEFPHGSYWSTPQAKEAHKSAFA